MGPTLLNYEEADAYRRGITNPVTRELVGLVFGVLTKKWLAGNRPIGGFDALFFVKILEVALASHDQIAGLLRGETTLWPD